MRESPRRRPAGLVAVAALLVGLWAAGAGVARSEAAWADGEVGAATFTAGTVAPPSSIRCSITVVGRPKFDWTHPTQPGLARDHYEVTVTPSGGSPLVTNLGANATTYTVPTGLLDLFGTGTVAVRAVHTSGWRSVAVTDTYTAVSLVLVLC